LLDVIVAGAGPAGNIAAHRLSQLGYRVAVLDWRVNVGDKLCTGIVGRECVECYQPDQADIYRDAQSATVIAPSGKSHRIFNDRPQAYIIDRVAFMASLAKRASEVGASFRLGENVVEVQRSATAVAVHTSSPSGARRYQARVIIIATGFGSPLLRMVGLGDGGSTEYMVGCQAEVVADGLEDTEVYLGDAVAPGSFGWLVPLSDSRALAGLVSRQKLNGHMPRFLSSLKQAGKVRSVTREPRRWGIPIKPLRRTFGDRVVVVGDAAGFVKPTTGGGIYYALLSGEIAADTVHEAFVADDLSAGGLKRYESRWKAIFGRELRIGYYARRLYEALGDDRVECLVNELLSARVQREFMSSREFSFDWHSGPILKALGHRELGKLIRSFGPIVAPFLPRLSRPISSQQRPQADVPTDQASGIGGPFL
jgi:geranylgeranyl reductase family protein